MHGGTFNWRHGATANCCSKPVLPISAPERSLACDVQLTSSSLSSIISLLITFQPLFFPSDVAPACWGKLTGTLRTLIPGISAGMHVAWQLQAVAGFDPTPLRSRVKQDRLQWGTKNTAFTRCQISYPDGALQVCVFTSSGLKNTPSLAAFPSCWYCGCGLFK